MTPKGLDTQLESLQHKQMKKSTIWFWSFEDRKSARSHRHIIWLSRSKFEWSLGYHYFEERPHSAKKEVFLCQENVRVLSCYAEIFLMDLWIASSTSILSAWPQKIFPFPIGRNFGPQRKLCYETAHRKYLRPSFNRKILCERTLPNVEHRCGDYSAHYSQSYSVESMTTYCWT